VQRILTAQQDQLIRRERSLLEDLRVLLVRLGAPDSELALLKRSLHQLDELFLLVVVGEFNAGKTAFLNALLGERLLTEGVLPTTSQIQLLRYGERRAEELTGDDILVVHLPVEWLREVNLVDTPGTNAIIQRHQEITEHFIPRSDLVLFVTSADRPFSESERLLLARIREWGKKIVMVVNKIDLIDQPDDRQQILAFVRDNSRHLLGVAPEVFPVSARQALQAKTQALQQGSPLSASPMWQQSLFESLERYILHALDATERLRLKLENPIGIADNLSQHYTSVIGNRRAVLKGDFEAIDAIEAQLEAYEADMRRDFQYHLSHVENVLRAMAERGDRFFDSALRLNRVFDLLNSEKIRGEFERQVLADTSLQIERHVSELIDWLVERDYRQWRAVMEYMARRAAHHTDKLVGQVNSDFEFNRQTLLAGVGREAQRVIDSYDRDAEALALAQEMQKAIIQTAAVEVGALGLGALLVALLNTTVLDITGIVGASAVAALGLYVLPYRRHKIKLALRERINGLRDQLSTALAKQFDQELSSSIQRIREAIAPYTRFVRVERDRFEKLEADLQAARVEVTALRHGAEALAAPGRTAGA